MHALRLPYDNLILVFWIYGLVFFSIGLSIIAQSRRQSSLRLRTSLKALAAFAVIHGFHEWMSMFILIGENVWMPAILGPLEVVRFWAGQISFSCFFLFGVSSLSLSSTKDRPTPFLFGLVYVLIYVYVLSVNGLQSRYNHEWFRLAGRLVRYVLTLPGGILIGVSFLRYRSSEEIARLKSTAAVGALTGAAIVFAGYALFAGLFVPYSLYSMPLSADVNSVLRFDGLPVQLFRTFSAFAVLFFSVRVLKIFDIERLTSIKRAMHELHISKKYIENILQSVADAVFVVDPQRRITLVNRAAVALLGYQESELVGSDFTSYMVRAPRGAEPDHLFLQGSASGAEAELQTKRGRRVLVLFAASPVYDNRNRLQSVVCIATDMSQHRKLEKEILKITHRERQLIGQELHDDLCQQLAGVAFLCKVMEVQLDKRGVRPEEITPVKQAVRRSIDKARAISRGLITVDLDEKGLVLAAKDFLREVQNVYGVRCIFTTPHDISFHDHEQSIHLFRIMQEAVNNAVKHGKATSIGVSFARSRGRIRLTVQDDGVGFIPAGTQDEGMGINIMKYRADIIGADLSIQSREPGVEVSCEIDAGENRYAQ